MDDIDGLIASAEEVKGNPVALAAFVQNLHPRVKLFFVDHGLFAAKPSDLHMQPCSQEECGVSARLHQQSSLPVAPCLTSYSPLPLIPAAPPPPLLPISLARVAHRRGAQEPDRLLQ